MAKSSVDQTLEIVKDLGKFKKRIADLAQAEESANNSVSKAKKTLQALHREMDEAVAATQEEQTRLKGLAKIHQKNIDNMIVPVREREGKVDRLSASLGKREDKLKQDQGVLKDGRAALKEDQVEFVHRVKAFNEVVINAVMTATD